MHLIWHIVKNDIDSVRMMLQSGIDVNDTYLWNSNDTFSPVLTNAHKKIEIDQEYQCLALNIAVLGGYYDMTRLLLSAGADINKRDGRGRTALICAIYGLDLDDSHLNSSNLPFISKTNPAHLDIIRNILLMDPHLDPKMLDSPQHQVKGITLLCLASYLCKDEVVKILLNDGRIRADGTDSKNATALMYAARDGNISIVSLLLEYQASPDIVDSHGWSSIQFADRNSNIIKLCEEQLRIKRLGLIPYYSAKNAAFNKIKLTKMKISSDTPVMHVTQTAFVQAIKTHDYIAVQHLLDKVLVNYHDPKTGMTALHYAVRTKQPPCLDTITILYQAGADVNAQTYYGRTCLHHLARFGTNADGTWGIQRSKKNAGTSKPNIELNNIHHHLGQCTSLLLQFGALVNIADPTGNTPLHFAAEFGGVPQVLEVLILEGNADLSWKNKKGATPLDVCKSDEIRNTIMELSIKQKQNQKCPSVLSSLTIGPSDSVSLISVHPQFLSNQDDFSGIQKSFFNYQTVMTDNIEASLGVLTDYFLKHTDIPIENTIAKLRFELKTASSIFEKTNQHIDHVMSRFHKQLEYFDQHHRSGIESCQSHHFEMENLFQAIDELDGQFSHLEIDLEGAICQVQSLRKNTKQNNESIIVSHCVYQLTQTLNLLELIPPELLHGQPCNDGIFDQLGYEITKLQQNENDPSFLQLFNEKYTSLYERWSTIRTAQINKAKRPVRTSHLKHARPTLHDLDQLELSFDILHSNLCEIQKDIEETTEQSETIAKQKRQMYDVCLALERELITPTRLESDIQSDLTHLLTYTQQLFEQQEQLDNDREQLKREQEEILKQVEKMESKLSKVSRTPIIRRTETSKIHHNPNIEKNELTDHQLKQLKIQCQSPMSHQCYTTRLDTSLYCLKSIANEWITKSRCHLVEIYSTLNQASVELKDTNRHALLLYENSVQVLKQVIILKKELEIIVTHRKEEVAKVWEVLDDVSSNIRFKNDGTNHKDNLPKTSSSGIRVEELDRHRWIIYELEQLQHVYDQLQYSIDNLNREQNNLEERINMFGTSLIDPQKNTLFGEGSVTSTCEKLSELMAQVKHANFGLAPVTLKEENKQAPVTDKSLKSQKRDKLSVDTNQLPISTNYTSPYTPSSVRQRRVSTEMSIMTDSKRMSAVSAKSFSSLSCYQQERMMTKVINLHNACEKNGVNTR